jgi:hypothetical protein
MTEQSLVDTAASIVHVLGVAGAVVTCCAIAVELIGAVAPGCVITLDLHDAGPKRRRRPARRRGSAVRSRRIRDGTASRRSPVRRHVPHRRPGL